MRMILRLAIAACLLVPMVNCTITTSNGSADGKKNPGDSCSDPSECNSAWCATVTCTSGGNRQICAGGTCAQNGCPSGQVCTAFPSGDSLCIPDTVCGGSSSSSGGGSSSSSGGGTSACGFTYAAASCASCVNASCCSQSQACSNDSACVAAFDCVNACASSDTTCQNNCLPSAPSNAQTELTNWINCLSSSCSSNGC